VEGALRAIGVTSAAVLRAMAAVPRERFVPASEAGRASANVPLPIGHGQTISAPDVVGWMTQALGVGPGDRVLDVGTGSGYQAAVLAALGCRVLGVEIVPELAAAAAERLASLGWVIPVRVGDGRLGWPAEAPFDGIVAAAAPLSIPPALVEQLRAGARLVIPVGPPAAQRLVVTTRREDGGADVLESLAVRFVPMVAARTGSAG
jgi:protein-L-isoaspartate(D-aspartate) O-methyltransferase